MCVFLFDSNNDRLFVSTTYDGIGVDEYMEWEIAIDNIFATRFMCLKRKVKNIASVL